MDIAARIAEHISETRYTDLTQEAVTVAKRCLLDTLGAGWAGSTAPGVRPVHDMVVEQGGRGECTVWAYPEKLPAETAAFLNSLMASAMEYDTLYAPGPLHADIVVAPAACAIAERQHSNGREFLTALVIGADLACRLAESTNQSIGWFYTSLHGVFGAVAATAKLLNLDRKAIHHALGIALGHVGGTQQSHIEQALTKRMHSAFAAKAGVFSGMLAERGVTGPSEVFEGRYGLYGMYEKGDPSQVVGDLGQNYRIVNTSFKKYPTCGYTHAAVDGTLELVQLHDLQADDVTGVEVLLTPAANLIVGNPFAPQENPQVTAQFSIQYCVASAILRRRLSLEDLTVEAVLDPRIQDMVDKIRVVVDESTSGNLTPSEVTINTRETGRLHRRVETVHGSPANPMSGKQLREKFLDCVQAGNIPLSQEEGSMVIERVDRLEELDDVAQFFGGFWNRREKMVG